MFLIFSMIPHFSSIGYLAWRPYACYIKTNSVMRVISGSFGRYITNEIQSPMECCNYEIGNFGYYFDDWVCTSWVLCTALVRCLFLQYFGFFIEVTICVSLFLFFFSKKYSISNLHVLFLCISRFSNVNNIACMLYKKYICIS